MVNLELSRNPMFPPRKPSSPKPVRLSQWELLRHLREKGRHVTGHQETHAVPAGLWALVARR